jgi:hypothetical protein
MPIRAPSRTFSKVDGDELDRRIYFADDLDHTCNAKRIHIGAKQRRSNEMPTKL